MSPRENARLDPAILAITAPEVRERGAAQVGTEAAARLEQRPAWLHLVLDVLDERVLPAVTYPQAHGFSGTSSSRSPGLSSRRPTSSESP